MPSTQSHRLQPGEWVLVTGANGYIGSHVTDVLLEQGLNVRGSVRVNKPWLNELFEKRHGKGRFETVIVSSMEDESALEAAMKGVSGVVHVAAVVQFNPKVEEVIPPVVAGTLAVLKVAASQPSIKSVVLTSSSSAAMVAPPDQHAVIDENTWNDGAVQAAWSEETAKQLPPDVLAFIIYAASKTESERKSWEWYREHKPHYAYNTVLPNYNLGEILCPEIEGSTMGWIRNLLDGDDSRVKNIPPQWFIDVKDDARLHVAALLDSSIQSERIFGYAAKFRMTEIYNLLHKLRPDNTKIPAGPENEGSDLTVVEASKRAEQIIKDFFGVSGFVGLEESLAAGIALHE